MLLRINIRKSFLMVALQQKRTNMPSRNFLVFKRELGINHVATDHSLRLGEIMLVVTVRAAKGNNSRNSVATTSCPSGTLLVIGAPRGHVRRATPDSAPMSIPTSMVVVLDNTSIAVALWALRPMAGMTSWKSSSFSSALENTSSF